MSKIALLFSILFITTSFFGGCTLNESKKLIGSWKYEYNISALLAESDKKAYFDLEEHKADAIITFREDNTYTFGFDETSLKTAMAEIQSELVDESEDYIRKIIADQGTIYQLFADSVMQDLLEDTEKEITVLVEELYKELSFTKSGTFIAKGGKIYWDNNSNEYDIYTLNQKTLTIDKPFGSKTDELYPMIFTILKQESSL